MVATVFAKRSDLKDLALRLGADATPERIRLEAQSAGLGLVGATTLFKVLNELWPDRKKRSSGQRRGWKAGALITGLFVDGAVSCPSCASLRGLKVYGSCALRDGNIRRHRKCKCGHKWISVDPPAARQPRRERLAAISATHKECGCCKQMLPVSMFGKKANDPHLYRTYCRPCAARKRRENYGKRSIRHLYGMTPEQYQDMLSAQQGLCSICGNPETGKRGERGYPLTIDHCHKTGAIRGLLCNKCNLGIGNFNDEAERLARAAAYLRRHGAAVEGEGR